MLDELDEPDESADELEEEVPSVAAVTCFALVVPASLHAIAPPRESAAATLSAAAARRAR